jgi:molybdate transport system permease protein
MTIDTQALMLTLKLAFFTLLFLIPFGIWVAYRLANMQKGKSFLEAALALPLVLPPTVLGYYLLVSFTNVTLFNQPLTFTFTGLVIASIIFNLPFAIQPIQRAFEAIPQDIREAAQCSGLNPWQAFKLIELPLAWRGLGSSIGERSSSPVVR